MSLLKFVASNWDAIMAAATAVGGWIWSRRRSRATDDLWDRLLAVARQQFPALLTYPDAHSRARDVLERATWEALDRLKIGRSKALEALVDELLDHSLAELAGHLMARDLRKIGTTLARSAPAAASAP